MSQRREWESAFGPPEQPEDSEPPAVEPRAAHRWTGWRRLLPGAKRARRQRAIWRGVPRAQRRRIARAIRRDELLHDPEDAPALLGVTRRQRAYLARQRRPVLLILRVGAVVWVGWQFVRAFAVSGGVFPTASLVVPACWFALEIWQLAHWRQAPARVARAEERHEQYLLGLGHRRPADEETVGSEPAQDESVRAEPADPQPRARGLFRYPLPTAIVLLFASFLLLGAVEDMGTLRDRHSPSRLPVYGVLLVAGIAISALATYLARRSWRLHTHIATRAFVALVGLAGVVFTIGWAIGLIRVMFFGA